ncbi:MAG: glycoside hydrolase, partial [Lutimonas sp.]
MHTLNKIGLILIVFVVLVSCEPAKKYDLNQVQSIHDSIKTIYAPDKRVALFDMEFNMKEDLLVLRGETNQKTALKILLGQLESKGWNVENQSHLLPDSTVGTFNYAVVNNSVANIRSQPKHSAELATQAILGMELKVL